MKIKLGFWLLSLSLCASGFVEAQTPQGDTLVEGDLDVQVNSNGDKGGLSVDGYANLGIVPLPMPNAIISSGLTAAWQYGPVLTSGQNYQVTYQFVKTASGTGDRFVDLPLGFTFQSSGAEIFASINDGNNNEEASWLVTGSRHRTIKCLEHSAYGEAKDLLLKGSMHHGRMMMFLDFNQDLVAGKTYEIRVTVNYRTGNFDLDNAVAALTTDYSIPSSLNQGNSIQPVELIESTVFEKRGGAFAQVGENIQTTKHWNGSEMILKGKVILSEPQGDISMGAFGDGN